MAAVSYDFSRVISSLDTSVAELQKKGHLYRTEPSLTVSCKTSLGKCLSALESTGSRFLLVHFPTGVPSQRPLQRLPSISSTSSPGVQSGLAATTVTEDGRRFSIVVETSDTEGSPEEKIREQELQALSTAASQSYLVLDGRDVVHLLLAQYRTYYGDDGRASETPPAEFAESLLSLSVAEVANLSGRNEFKAMDEEVSLRRLLQTLEHTTRVAIFKRYTKDSQTNPPELLGVFSAEHFFAYLDKESRGAELLEFPPSGVPLDTLVTALSTKLSSLDHWTAGSIKRATQPLRTRHCTEVHACLETQPVLGALKILDKTGFNALPLLGEDDPRRCKGVFSIRDVQPILLRAQDFGVAGTVLNMTVMDYVARVRQMADYKARAPTMQVRESASLDAVLGKLVAAKVGRLIITDDDGHMTNVLSVTDVARFMARELAQAK